VLSIGERRLGWGTCGGSFFSMMLDSTELLKWTRY
jgi:hypothetical protein